jgi:hypothetical protein
MSDFRNEEGEYLMTDAELRLEWALDQQSAEERFEEDWYERNYREPECDHSTGEWPDLDQQDDYSWACSWCGETAPEDEWPDCSECGEPNEPGQHDRCCSKR